MAIVGFFDLKLPAPDGPYWFMACDGDRIPGYLLNHTPHIGDIPDYPATEFYFDSASSAHAHAAGYYLNHGKLYPYEEQWRSSLLCESGIEEDNVVTDSVESQVMVFE